MSRTLLIGAACLVVGFALGRQHRAPVDEQTHETYTEEVTLSSETEEAATEESVTDTEVERTRIVFVDRWRTPEGAEREQRVELDTETLRELTETVRVETRIETVEVEVVREIEVERLVRTPAPDWRLQALVGLSDKPTYGLGVERRIVGPIHLGLAATTHPTVFLTASVSF